MADTKVTRIDDGGPAFPRTGHFDPQGPASADCEPQDGMSLRDYLAGQALAGWSETHHNLSFSAPKAGPLGMAWVAYEIADAMIAARKGGAQ